MSANPHYPYTTSRGWKNIPREIPLHPGPIIKAVRFALSSGVSATKTTFRYSGKFLKAFFASIAMFPMAVAAGDHFIQCQKVDGFGKTIYSMSLGADAYELISVAVAVLVFWKIIRFVVDD